MWQREDCSGFFFPAGYFSGLEGKYMHANYTELTVQVFLGM